MNESVVYNMDCMEYMRALPDKAFDLAIVDPPYGDAVERERESKLRFHGSQTNPNDRWTRYKQAYVKQLHGSGSKKEEADTEGGTAGFLAEPSVEEGRGVARTGGTWAAKYGKHIVDWDVAQTQEYFDELFRISKNQIIWGGNYFRLPPDKMLFDLAEVDDIRELHNGDGRVCLDKF